jgi:hypothetical protein
MSVTQTVAVVEEEVVLIGPLTELNVKTMTEK